MMNWTTIAEVGAAIMISLGGAGVIILGASSWFGKIWASKILEKDRADYRKKIEIYTHQLTIQKASYERYLDLIVNYHDLIYRHYRLCQQTESVDKIKHPDKGVTDTKQDFMEQLDLFVESLAEIEGKIRIILPQETLDLHEGIIGEFNTFRGIVKEFSNDAMSLHRKELHDSMARIVEVQKNLETSLRHLLRTENVLR